MSQESRKIWLIIPFEDRAMILRVIGDAVASFSVQSDDETSLAKVIANVFLEQEYNSEPVLLAPCSHDVLAVSMPADSSANRQAMIYELEEYVPIPAEQFTADFLQHDQCRWAGLITHQKFLPLLDELATNQILVQHIVPLSVLVAQNLISRNRSRTFDYFLGSITRYIIKSYDNVYKIRKIQTFNLILSFYLLCHFLIFVQIWNKYKN